MSFIDHLSVNEAEKITGVHPMKFVGKVNSSISPWIMYNLDFKNSSSGQMVMHIEILDTTKRGAMLMNKATGEEELGRGIAITFPIENLLPTEGELEVLIETIRQELQITGANKIYMGR